MEVELAEVADVEIESGRYSGWDISNCFGIDGKIFESMDGFPKGLLLGRPLTLLVFKRELGCC